MYANCMFCTGPLGSNQAIEAFPVGRRLAFDEARGRLWVVCPKCSRWNLTPIEERWEAVETCERLFRATSVRTSTENIGLARHPEGLELVRIGRPLRPEFAAWRYGDQFGRRRRKALIISTGAIALSGLYITTVITGGASLGIVLGASVLSQIDHRRGNAKLRRADGTGLKLRWHDIYHTHIRPADSEPHFKIALRRRKQTTWHEGEEARHFAAIVLSKLNKDGGSNKTVRDAVAAIESSGHPGRFVADAVALGDKCTDRKGAPGYVARMRRPTRLALEMALHEEQERRALEGELWLLERAWKDAEAIAELADNLLVPKAVETILRRLPGRRRPIE